MRGVIVATLLAIAAAAGPASPAAQGAVKGWRTYNRPARYSVTSEMSVPITMPDGTVLRANVYRPNHRGRFPVLLFQDPYGANGPTKNDGGASDPYLVQRGYVQVVVDVRGTGQSQGSWNAFSAQEQRDGYDLVQWAARQPWSDGRVGGAGCSYLAIEQLFTAVLHPPHLKAIFPCAAMSDAYRDMVMTGGSVDTSFIPAWVAQIALGMIQPPATDPESIAGLPSKIAAWTNTSTETTVDPLTGSQLAYDGPFWQTRSPLEVADRIRVPTFMIGGLHDIFQRGEPLLYEKIKRHAFARLLIGPWMHLTYFSGLPADGVPDEHHLELMFYDRFLKGLRTPISSTPKVTQYQWGSGRYVASQDWPSPKLKVRRLYLRGSGRLEPGAPKHAEASQSFLQDPGTGICTLSSSQWTAGAAGYLPCETDPQPDQTLGEASYETAPLSRRMTVNGPILADIWLSTTAREAPITVRVSDVAPGGSANELTDGWLSAGFRALDPRRSRYVNGQLLQPWHPFTSEATVNPGTPYKLAVEVFPTDAMLAKGHRLKITVSSGDFPHQIAPLPMLAGSLAGRTTILTDPAHRSYIALPETGSRCTLGRRSHGKCRALPTPRLIAGNG